jgi:hypothetical protein
MSGSGGFRPGFEKTIVQAMPWLSSIEDFQPRL